MLMRFLGVDIGDFIPCFIGLCMKCFIHINKAGWIYFLYSYCSMFKGSTIEQSNSRSQKGETRQTLSRSPFYVVLVLAKICHVA